MNGIIRACVADDDDESNSRPRIGSLAWHWPTFELSLLNYWILVWTICISCSGCHDDNISRYATVAIGRMSLRPNSLAWISTVQLFIHSFVCWLFISRSLLFRLLMPNDINHVDSKQVDMNFGCSKTKHNKALKWRPTRWVTFIHESRADLRVPSDNRRANGRVFARRSIPFELIVAPVGGSLRNDSW